METLEELFHETLRDIYYAEKKILKALPKMAKRASSRDLAAAYEAHLQETEDQVERLEKVFEMLGKSARGKGRSLATDERLTFSPCASH